MALSSPDPLALQGTLKLVYSLALSSLCFLFAFVLRDRLLKYLFNALEQLVQRAQLHWNIKHLQLLRMPLSQLYMALFLYYALIAWPLSPEIMHTLHIVLRISTLSIGFLFLYRCIDLGIEVFKETHGERIPSLVGFVPLARKVLLIFLSVLWFLLMLENFGYPMNTVIASLGIGLGAFAFAAKDSLGQLYAAFSLALDRPFVVGDWIEIDQRIAGTVESVGLRSTRLRTAPKTVMVIPSSTLANAVINNLTSMPKRRVRQIISLTYDTTAKQTVDIIEKIKAFLSNHEEVDPDYIVVSLDDFGDSGLQILVIYFTKATAWAEHQESKHKINLSMMELLAQNGLKMAFPSRSIYLENTGEPKSTIPVNRN